MRVYIRQRGEPASAAQIEAEVQNARRARQRAYRARQAEVVGLLSALWRLRRHREAGGGPGLVSLPEAQKWDLLAELVRELIHEEGLVAAAVRRASGGASAKGRASGPLTIGHISARNQDVKRKGSVTGGKSVPKSSDPVPDQPPSEPGEAAAAGSKRATKGKGRRR